MSCPHTHVKVNMLSGFAWEVCALCGASEEKMELDSLRQQVKELKSNLDEAYAHIKRIENER